MASHIQSRRALLAKIRAGDVEQLNFVMHDNEQFRIYQILDSIQAGKLTLEQAIESARSPEAASDLSFDLAGVLLEQIDSLERGGLLRVAYHLCELCYAAACVQQETKLIILFSEHLGNIIDDLADKTLLERRVCIYSEGLAAVEKLGDGDLKLRASFLTNLANAHSELAKYRDFERNSARAMSLYKEALEIFTIESEPASRATVESNLGNAYHYASRGSPESGSLLVSAESHLTSALQIYESLKDAYGTARVMNSLANISKELWRLDRSRTLERAIMLYEKALSLIKKADYPFQYATWLTNLGLAYTERAKKTDSIGQHSFSGKEDLKRAATFYSMALDVFTADRFPHQHADVQIALCGTYEALAALEAAQQRDDERISYIRKALSSIETAIAIFSQDTFPEQFAEASSRKATLMMDWCESLDQAAEIIDILSVVVDVRVACSSPVRVLRARHNLAAAYTTLGVSKSQQAVEIELLVLREAKESGETGLAKDAAKLLGNTYSKLGDPKRAFDYWSLALNYVEDDLDLLLPLPDYDHEFEQDVTDLHRRLALLLLDAGDSIRALEHIERSRSSLLLRRLRAKTVPLIQGLHNDSDVRAFYETINVLTSTYQKGVRAGTEWPHEIIDQFDAAVREYKVRVAHLRKVHPQVVAAFHDCSNHDVTRIVCEAAGTAFITCDLFRDRLICLVLFGREGRLQSRTYDRVAVGTLDKIISWISAYETFSTDLGDLELEKMKVALYHVLDHLSATVFTQILEDLKLELDITRIIFVPDSNLSILPLHALHSGRHDDCYSSYYQVSFAQSFALFEFCKHRRRDEKLRRKILIVNNPWCDLTWADCESAYVSSLVHPDDLTVCRWADATVPKVSEELMSGIYKIVHFACHGIYDWQSPWKTGLSLAIDDNSKSSCLTLREMRDRELLRGVSLVVLSSCSVGRSSVVARASPETVSLPNALLSYGCSCVIASLWPVDDLATAVLMGRFYEEIILRGLSPSEALAVAQSTVRHMENNSLIEWIDRLRESVKASAVERDLSESEFSQLEKRMNSVQERRNALVVSADAGSRPFDHPYYWAGFFVSGE